MSAKRGAYWSLPTEELLDQLKSSEKGLSTEEAQKRLKIHGYNTILGKEKNYGWRILLAQFRNALMLILVIAATLAYFLGEKIEALAILVIVIINALLGFFQEYKAEKAVRELKKYIPWRAQVLREGELTEILSTELVPGDIIYFRSGEIVPADTRLLHAEGLTADETALTGESSPVLKHAGTLKAGKNLPQDLPNMLFMGTSLASGFGHGIITATGEKTFFGQSSVYLKRSLPETDFQKNLRIFSNFLLKVVLAMTVFIFAANALLGKGILTSFLFALALAVGITPEVLPVIITLALSSGALRMAKEKVIIKKLSSVEDLGNMDLLCSDKTGTLTEGELELQDYLNLEQKRDPKLLINGLLCNSLEEKDSHHRQGNFIDKAIWRHKAAHLFLPEARKSIILGKNEFDFERRRMSVLVHHYDEPQNTLLVKGAPEAVIQKCTHLRFGRKKVSLSGERLVEMHQQVRRYEEKRYTVIALAEKSIGKQSTSKSEEKSLVLSGFLLFLDPPKKGVKQELSLLKKLGVEVKIVSGDSPIVTRRVCQEVSFKIAEERVVTGEELDKLHPRQWKEYCLKYNVFARVTPAQKYAIVSALRKENHLVGFLGDGINDAPALKIADVGISVHTAAGIAREAADVILLKKSLKVLSDGILLGRKTFGNITKYILNTISANYGNMFTLAISSLFLPFLPLLPVQILLNNLLSDMPSLTISTDRVDPELTKKPRHWDMKLISRFMVYFGLLSSFFDLLLIGALLFLFHAQAELFRTAWFIESLLSEILILLVLRTHLPFFRSRPSWWVLTTSLLVGTAAVIITYFPWGKALFSFVPLPGRILGLIGAILIAYVIVTEFVKRRFFQKFEL